eukprot:CAMPEP_0206273810 /NCGR_PEP_ID=MMETSP0047_2-20121206/34809_1 /ASSEMBLY_ACC=CAM_ASM_000192 /TAXON_ID=195065 /ORGANISM="Chroomonas mesostigmatica_cf, Strain CCMP1168" /LENGTH=112 /DNA_ID=CAMNT_0053702961 /DNA_START=54 /DNA_END=389 /DNA_ORIENTATION=-
MPEEDGALSYTILEKDARWDPPSLSEDLTPLSVSYWALKHPPGTASSVIRMQHLIYYPPLPLPTMAALRALVGRHATWTERMREAADALYVPEEMDEAALERERDVQARIVA